MNWEQLICMWAGIAIFVLFAFTTQTRFVITQAYQLTDYGPLVARLTTTAAVTVGLVLSLAGKKDKK